jgi:hypothetical protein
MLQRRAALFGLACAAALAAACTPTAAPAPAAPAEAAASAGGSAAAPTDPPAEAAADEVTHTVTTAVEGSGADRALVATVTPAPGFHCNMEYPRWQVQIADDAPALAGARASRDDAPVFTEEAVTFRIPVPADATPGDVAGQVRFSVCNDEACLMPTEPVAWTLAAAQ